MIDIPTLCRRLKRDRYELDRLADLAPQYYRRKQIPKLNPDKSYKISNGEIEYRPIDASQGHLKEVQSNLKGVLSEIPLSPSVFGVRGKGHARHAERHKGKNHHFKTDLYRFFPSVSREAVAEALMNASFDSDAANLVAGLTTLRGSVPQGAPTSNHVTNAAFREVDFELEALCGQLGLVYSRFVDDLLFSGQSNFKSNQEDILSAIRDKGFEVNHEKTAYKVGPIFATGITIRNNELALDPFFFERLSNSELSEKSRRGTAAYIADVTGHEFSLKDLADSR